MLDQVCPSFRLPLCQSLDTPLVPVVITDAILRLRRLLTCPCGVTLVKSVGCRTQSYIMNHYIVYRLVILRGCVLFIPLTPGRMWVMFA